MTDPDPQDIQEWEHVDDLEDDELDDLDDDPDPADERWSEEEPPARRAVADNPEVARARAAFAAAQAAAAAAAARLSAARDALADTEGAARVAHAKADAFAGDDTKTSWQQAQAAEATAHVEAAAAAVDTAVAIAEASAAANASAASDETAPLYYPTVEVFVRDRLAYDYRRAVGHHRVWCPAWWRHTEAVARLEALWRSWEHLRLDPATGISVWFRDHADHHMTVLFDPDGPFKYCSPDKGHSPRLEALPLEDPPEGLFQSPVV